MEKEKKREREKDLFFIVLTDKVDLPRCYSIAKISKATPNEIPVTKVTT